MTCEKGLMLASSTVIWAFSDLPARGRMTLLRKAELVPTKYKTTSNKMRTAKMIPMRRPQRARGLTSTALSIITELLGPYDPKRVYRNFARKSPDMEHACR